MGCAMRLRLPGGQRNFVMFLLVAVGAFVITLYVSPSEQTDGDQITAPAPVISSTAPMVTTGPTPIGDEAKPETAAAPSADDPGGFRSYALPLVEVQGLPPD